MQRTYRQFLASWCSPAIRRGIGLAPKWSYVLGWMLAAAASCQATAQQSTPQVDAARPIRSSLKLGNSGFQLTIPTGWVIRAPRSQMIEHELAVVDVDQGAESIRVTIMPAGGSIEANVDRWIAQFQPETAGPVANKASPNQRPIAGKTVHLVDLSGTYLDRPQGPQGPAVSQVNYRMLGAVLELDGTNYFIKLYGPADAVANVLESYDDFLSSLQRTGNG